MKLFKTLSFAALAVFAVGLSSCNDDDNTENIYEYRFGGCYSVVTDLQNDGESTVAPNVAFTMLANWDNGSSQFEMSGFSIGSYNYPIITIKGSKWGQLSDSPWFESKGSTAAVVATGSPLSIENFKLMWHDRTELVPYLGVYDPAVAYQFVLDGRYKVAGSRQPFCISGTTVSTSPAGSSYTSQMSLYVIGLNFTTRTATINITNASFAANMPSLNMQFAGIPFAVDSDANVTLECDALIPTIADVPQPNYPISNLKCVVNPGQGRSTLEFVCDFRGAPFTVVADLGFDTYKGFVDSAN